MRKALLVIIMLAPIAGCAMFANDTQHPPIPTGPVAMPYAQARAKCFEEGFGIPSPGINSTADRERAYYRCLEQMGWGSMRP